MKIDKKTALEFGEALSFASGYLIGQHQKHMGLVLLSIRDFVQECVDVQTESQADIYARAEAQRALMMMRPIDHHQAAIEDTAERQS